jgi:hypothetical protein
MNWPIALTIFLCVFFLVITILLYRFSRAKMEYFSITTPIPDKTLVVSQIHQTELARSYLREGAFSALTSLLGSMTVTSRYETNLNIYEKAHDFGNLVKKLLSQPGTSLQTVEYNGRGTWPVDIHEGDQKKITLKLERATIIQGLQQQEGEIKAYVLNPDGTQIIEVTFQVKDISDQYLLVELVAPATYIPVNNVEKEERQPLTQQTLNYYWNCSFIKYGEAQISLEFKLTDPANPSIAYRLGIPGNPIEKTIHIKKCDNISLSLVRVTYGVTGLLTVFVWPLVPPLLDFFLKSHK